MSSVSEISRQSVGQYYVPRSKRLLISWLQSPSAVNLEPPKIKSGTVSTVTELEQIRLKMA